MASSYTDLGTELMATGENAGNWGTKTNTNIQIIEEAIAGYATQALTSGGTVTLTYSDGSTGDVARHAVIALTGSLSGNAVVEVPSNEKIWIIDNQSTNAYTVTVRVNGQTGVTWATTDKGTKILYTNGTDVVDTGISSNILTSGTGDITLDSAADIVIDAAGGNVEFKDAGTTQLTLDMDGTAGAQVLKLGVDSDDLVFQQYDGTEVMRIEDGAYLNVSNSTASSSATTGSAIFGGGIGVAADAYVGDDVYLISDSAVLGFGADSEIKFTHVADTGLTLKHTATADDKPIILTLQTGETDIAADDVIGTINFQAPDEAQGTDAILVAAGIEAVSEGDFSSSNNATKLSFKTGASEAAAEKVAISSAGNLSLTASNTELRFYEGSNYVGFEAPALSADQIWVLPSADGSSGQQLQTDGSGNLSWAAGSSADPSSADGDSLGTSSAEWSDLYLADGSVIYFGNDQEITLTHVADTGLNLKHTATADDKPIVLTLQTGETDMAANDVIGAIRFQAPDEAQGTDAILVAAAIQAVSEGDFSSSNNATKLEFHTGASEAASSKMTLSSAGLLTIADDLMIKDGGTIGVASTNDALTISSAGLLTVKDDLVIKSGGTIGGSGDTDLLTLGSAILTVAGEVQMTTLDIGGTNVTSTAAELNKLDGVGTLKQAGTETIWVPAVAMYPSSTGGAPNVATTEITGDSNRPVLKAIAFDKDSDEYAQFAVAFPKSWDEGTVTFQPFFTANTTNTGTALFMLKGIAVSDNDAISTDFGTAQGTAKAHSGTAYDLDVGAESSAITIAGSPAAGDQIFFAIFRDVSGDNLTADALLLGVKLHYTTNAANDD